MMNFLSLSAVVVVAVAAEDCWNCSVLVAVHEARNRDWDDPEVLATEMVVRLWCPCLGQTVHPLNPIFADQDS